MMQLGSEFLLLHFLTTLHVSGASCTHHQELFYSCCAPDDGCKKRPKHVE